MRTSLSVNWLLVRSHNEGSIFRRKRDGKWSAAVSMPGGRRVERRAEWYDNTRERAKELLKALLEERDAELVPTRKLTTEAWLREWLAEMEASSRVRPATMRYYRMAAEVHIIPALGKIALATLGPTAIQRWLDGMNGSPRSIQHRRDVLRAALNVAVRRRRIMRNPTVGVEIPALPKKDIPILSAEQARALIEGTAGEWYGALWALLIGTGLRISEALGLTWDDLDGDEIIVSSQLARRDGAWVLAPTKAGRSVDRIALPIFSQAALQAHRAMMAAARTPDWMYFGHIFVTPAGSPPYAWHVTEALYAAEVRLGLPRVGPHQLRHTNVTLMADAGVPEEIRMQRVGHVTRAMARHYVHGGEVQDRLAADTLERLLGRGR